MVETEYLAIQTENSKQAKHLIESEETNLRLIGEKVRNVQVQKTTSHSCHPRLLLLPLFWVHTCTDCFPSF